MKIFPICIKSISLASNPAATRASQLYVVHLLIINKVKVKPRSSWEQPGW